MKLESDQFPRKLVGLMKGFGLRPKGSGNH